MIDRSLGGTGSAIAPTQRDSPLCTRTDQAHSAAWSAPYQPQQHHPPKPTRISRSYPVAMKGARKRSALDGERTSTIHHMSRPRCALGAPRHGRDPDTHATRLEEAPTYEPVIRAD